MTRALVLIAALLAGCATTVAAPSPTPEAVELLEEAIVANAVNYSDRRLHSTARRVSLANANTLSEIYQKLTGGPLPLGITLRVQALANRRDADLRAGVAAVSSEAP